MNDPMKGRTLVGRAIRIDGEYMVDFQFDLRDRMNQTIHRKHPHLYEGQTMRQDSIWRPTHWIRMDRQAFRHMTSLAGEDCRRQGEYDGNTCVEFAVKADLKQLHSRMDGLTIDMQGHIEPSPYHMHSDTMMRQDAMIRQCHFYGSCAMHRTAELQAARPQRPPVKRPDRPAGLREVDGVSDVYMDRFYE